MVVAKDKVSDLDRLFKFLSEHAVWVVTISWAALMLLKALVVARGSPPVAVAILSGPNLVAAASNAGLFIAITVLGTVAGLGPLLIALRKTLKSRLVIVLAFSFAAWIALLVAAPLGFALLVPVQAFAILALLELLRHFRRTQALRNKPVRKINLSFRTFARLGAAAMAVMLAIQVVITGTWMQTENVRTLDPRDSFVGSYITQDAKFTSFLREQTRQVVIVETDAIAERTVCTEANWGWPPSLVPLAFTLGRVPSPRPPTCYKPGI